MSETVSIVKVFLASPGDLKLERKLANEAVEEINKRFAPHLGFIVELKGWEDTLSASGRPQAIINQELKRCELFIGIMWKKWGTPPDTEGRYSSGFEEEFDISFENFKESGAPEIAMYFKEIDPEFLTDPGEDLKKVILFRDRLISEKVILFEGFDTPAKFQQCVRRKITDYLILLKEIEKEVNEEEQTKPKKIRPWSENDYEESRDKESVSNSPFEVEGYYFLNGVINKTEGDSGSELTAVDVARFRLISCSISKPGNDEEILGVHDANILFSNRKAEFGNSEISSLIDCGLTYFSNGNAPLWYWCKSLNSKSGMREGVLLYKSLGKKVGAKAIHAMKLIGESLPTGYKGFTREFLIENWLSENNSNEIKTAALSYLKEYGEERDLEHIKEELDRGEHGTMLTALEAVVSIQSRNNEGDAIETLFSNQFLSFDDELLDHILPSSINIDVSLLKSGLSHRNHRIRLESVRQLEQKGEITVEEVETLKSDSSAKIRKALVDYLLRSGQKISDAEAKEILVQPQNGRGLPFISSNTDYEGEAQYDLHLYSKYSGYSKKQLSDLLLKLSSIYNMIPYFVLCDRFFRYYGDDVRGNVDDQFESKFREYLVHLERLGAGPESLKKHSKVGDYIRKELTRDAVKLLCAKSNKSDLERIRSSRRSGFIESSIEEVRYFKKWGEWEDIPYILDAELPFALRATVFSRSPEWDRSIAECIYYIGKDKCGDLLKIKMSNLMLVELLKLIPVSKFSKLEREDILSLLDSEDDDVRKYTSIKCIQSFTKGNLKALFSSYISQYDFRYYNVTFWFDFGISVSHGIVKKVLKSLG